MGKGSLTALVTFVSLASFGLAFGARLVAPLHVRQFGPIVSTKSLPAAAFRGEARVRTRSSTNDVVKTAISFFASEDIVVEVTDDYIVSKTGARNVYLRQVVDGLPVLNAVGNINIAASGEVLSNYHTFTSVTPMSRAGREPALTPADALGRFHSHLHLEVPRKVHTEETGNGNSKSVIMEISNPVKGGKTGTVSADLHWLQMEDGGLRLVWQLKTSLGDAAYDACVDAHRGEVLRLVDHVHWFAYKIFPADPDHGAQEVRQELVDPDYAPRGWHYPGVRDTRGNNVEAQENFAGGSEWENNYRPSADATNLFGAPFDAAAEPRTNIDAGITNIFYHTNLFHDYLYQAGFDEPSGNYQRDNFGRGGLGNDPVIALVQDGRATNNANFQPQPDGTSGKLALYVFTYTNPNRDVALDTSVVWHELAHGVSKRLIGGPSTIECLVERPVSLGLGEGYSDLFAVILNTRAESTRQDSNHIGEYMLGRPGTGFRSHPYSSNTTVCPLTYSDAPLQNPSAYYPVGEVWTIMLYEVYWNFIESYGFDPDWLNHSRNAGNHRFLRSVLDGMRAAPCQPNFITARDAFLRSVLQDLDRDAWCLAWKGFATRGLGTNANTNAVDSFELPPECSSRLQGPDLRT